MKKIQEKNLKLGVLLKRNFGDSLIKCREYAIIYEIVGKEDFVIDQTYYYVFRIFTDSRGKLESFVYLFTLSTLTENYELACNLQ